MNQPEPKAPPPEIREKIRAIWLPLFPDTVIALCDFREMVPYLPFSDIEKALSAMCSITDFLEAHHRLRDEHILDPDVVEWSAAAAERYQELLTAFCDLIADLQAKAIHRASMKTKRRRARGRKP